MYYIYHIPGEKIGCTKDYPQRCIDQGFSNYELLETHNDGQKAGDRELELQKQYGYPVDKSHYMHSAGLHVYSKGVSKPNHPGPTAQARSNSGKAGRNLTYEQAQEIRAKYIPRKYTADMLAEEYGVLKTTIRKIVYNQYYLEP